MHSLPCSTVRHAATAFTAFALDSVVTGFAASRHALVGLGLLALLGYLSRFYYALDQTLLAKSATLVTSGVAILALGIAIDRLYRVRGSNGRDEGDEVDPACRVTT